MRTLLTPLLGVVSFSACGSCTDALVSAGTEKVTGVRVSNDDTTVTYKTKDGTLSMGAGVKAPTDLPVKAPADAVIVMSTQAQGQSMVVFTTNQSVEALAEQYEKDLTGRSFKVERAEQHMAELTLISLSFRGSLEGGVQLQHQTPTDDDSGPHTSVTVSWMTSKPTE
ncbi:MAG: hypothetical protein SFW67_20210 [Myxococcaceae bacterium]|nr:hypothetical protein [Myxococcaceae bacterium]